MIRKSIYILLFIVISFSVTGCTTDVKDIEKLNYVSAIGVDYKDGKYHGYIQFIDYFSAAKTADGQKQPAKIWVGEGVGDNFEESLFNLYRTAQEKIYWGHLTAIVISEAAFKQGIGSIYDSFVRYSEFRLTPWVYGTKESIKDIFSTTGFYGQSPLSTILHEPQGIYSQTSLIKSIKLHRLINQINEPGFTSCIPVLAINKKQWTEKNTSEPKLMIDGAIFLKNENYRSYIPLQELSGLRWIQSGSVRAALTIPSKKNSTVQIAIDEPKTKLKLINIEDKPHYNVDMKATGYIVSRTKNNLMGLQELTEKTKDAIEKEIKDLYKTGLKRRTDVLNLEYNLYRNHFRQWKAMSPAEDTWLAQNTIHDIHIDLNITHSSSEKVTSIQRSK